MKLKQFFNTHQEKLTDTIYENIDRAHKDYPLQVGKAGLLKLRESVAGGKMIRGMLVLMSVKMHGKEILEEHYHLAAAIEILHTAFLIHDDIMDNDYRRRNHDSVYYQYIKEGEEKGVPDPKHYGMSMAMCLGDMIFFLVTQIIATRIYDPEISQCIIGYVSQEVQHIGPAQMMDAAYGQLAEDPTEEEINQIYTYKTAHYTFSLPMIIGAVFSSYVRTEQLKALGQEMGIIFQLRDDELGIFGTTDEIGKEVGSDIRENKKTLLRHLLFAHASQEDVTKLTQIFGNHQISHEDIVFVQNTLKKNEVQQIIQKQIETREKQAQEILNALEKDGLDIVIIRELLEYIQKRKS